MRVHEFKKNKSPSYSFLELFLNYNSMKFHCPWIMYYYLWRSFWDQVLKRFFFLNYLSQQWSMVASVVLSLIKGTQTCNEHVWLYYILTVDIVKNPRYFPFRFLLIYSNAEWRIIPPPLYESGMIVWKYMNLHNNRKFAR